MSWIVPAVIATGIVGGLAYLRTKSPRPGDVAVVPASQLRQPGGAPLPQIAELGPLSNANLAVLIGPTGASGPLLSGTVSGYYDATGAVQPVPGNVPATFPPSAITALYRGAKKIA